MKKKKSLLTLVMIGCLLLGGCGKEEPVQEMPESQMTEETNSETETQAETTEETTEETVVEEVVKDETFLWLAYWNYKGYEQELACLGENNRAVSVFGVLFDCNGDKPFLTPETEELLTKVKAGKGENEVVYLSFINDLRLEDGSYSNKDPELLARLFEQPENRERHIAEIVEFACESGVDGIEIDYENLKKKEELWEPFCLFLEELKKQCDEKGLLLRVVLGAYDVDKAQFPEGIEYAVMCYNLYGTHSGPGPKADVTFLRETFEKCKALPGNVSAAFSTGGFVWAGDKCEKALTETEAAELYASLGENASALERDSASGALHFTYTQDGVCREVWYADGETLCLWKQTAKEYGITRFSLWKAGGNVSESLRSFVE